MSTATVPAAHASADLQRDPVAPVREALIASARRDAQATEQTAEQQARAILEQAQSQADSIRAQARAQGEADAAQVRAEQRARARRRARTQVLAGQRAALDQVRTAVHLELRRRWDDPDTRQVLRCRLVELARSQLGDDAVIADHPDAGIVATVGHRRGTFLLPDLADQVLDDLGPDIESLWTP